MLIVFVACEGHRRMDLLRWGILLEVVKNTIYKVHNPKPNILQGNVLLPIPLQEIILNPNLPISDLIILCIDNFD